MPFSITCPACSAKLKTAAAIPVGRSIQCPKCSEKFKTTSDNMVEVGAGANGAAAPSPALKKAVADNPFGGMAAPAGRKNSRDDDEDNRPRAKRSDEDRDEQKPRARKPMSLDNDEEDEDRPVARKRRAVDEDEGRPVARKRRAVDEDEERPTARKRRDDDDEDDDGDDRDRRPRPKKKKKKGNLGVIIGASVFGLLVLTGIGFGLYWLFSGNNYDTEMMAFLPAETNVMVGIDVEDLMNNEKVKGYVKKITAMDGPKETMNKLKDAGITENDVSRILLGMKADDGAAPAAGKQKEETVALVVRFKKSVDKAKIAKSLDATEQKKNDKVYYRPNKPGSHSYVHFPSDSMLVLVSTEKQLDSVLANSSKVVISEEMQDISKKLSKGQIWVAFSRSAVDSELKNIDEAKPMLTLVGIPADAATKMIAAVKSMRGGGGYLKLDGDKLSIGLGIQCSDAKTASEAAESWSKAFQSDTDKSTITKAMLAQMPTETKNAMEESQKSFKSESSGNMWEMTSSVSLGSIDSFVNMATSPPKRGVPVQQQPVEQPQTPDQAQPGDQPQPKAPVKKKNKR
jgi:hypothetical protein